MASLVSVLAKTQKYSSKYDYPLSLDEVWYWQIGTAFSKAKIKKYYQKQNFTIRQQREKYSAGKWRKAYSVANSLSRLKTIEAIFVTGALAMNNSPVDDDIDLMLVTKPDTLWLTRILIFFVLKDLRRPTRLPEHSSVRVSDKICDNLYLDSSHLYIHTHNLYTAHEVLQAKCIFDRSNIAYRFIASNSWVGDYLPVAHRESLKKLNKLGIGNYLGFGIWGLVIAPINLVCFILQYLYMRPKITNEKISLHSAFFHPRKNPLDKKIEDLVYIGSHY